MNGTHDTSEISTSEELDPRQAAKLLEHSTRKARRTFDLSSPLLSVLGATVVLFAFAAVWLSVRDQHPYKGPTAAGLLVMYGILICWIAVVITFRHRATTGVSGRSIRQQRAYATAVITALIGVSVLQGILKHDRVSPAIVYGIYPPTAQLIALGAIGAAIAATREEWPGFAVAIAVAILATASAFAGPRGVWLSDGIGCSIVVLAYAANQTRTRRATPNG